MTPNKVPHRFAVRALVSLGSILAILAIFGVWAERQLLDTNEYVSTTSKLLDDPKIQTALSEYLTNQLFTAVDVEKELEQRLPARVKPLAGPIAGGLRPVATDSMAKALATSQVADAWAAANRAAHTLLLNLLEGNGELVQSQGGVVTLNLRALVLNLATQIGISAEVTSKLPPDVASLEILRSDQLSLGQDAVKALHGLAIVLSLLALGSLALAIYLSRGRRYITVLWSGLALIGAGVVVLAIRKYGGDAVVNSVVVNDANKPAAHDVWAIATSLMKSIATTVIVYGVLFAIAAWLASPTASAREVRRGLAPTLRDHRAAPYALLLAAALIYFALAPTHGLRAFLTLTLLTVLTAFGLTALRRQAAEEAPDAARGDTAARVKAWASGQRRPAAAPAPERTDEERRLDALERLGRLREQGVLSEQEFASEKARVVGLGAEPSAT